GLTHEAHRKEVEQVYLRCAAGAVEWMYPTGALIVNLRPNTFSPARHLTVCIKPFVRGSIQEVTHEPERQDSAIHLRVSRLYRQKSRVFEPAPEGDGHWQGRVRTLLECGVRPGHGDFLFTGHMHFGEARLGCAPRFKDFQRMYRDAQERGLNPCEVGTD
uniref:Meteorin-like protein n=1 Tax=Nomascus leucogenys TaxID=61853 RepID=A0A2I3GHF4_NOMLE